MTTPKDWIGLSPITDSDIQKAKGAILQRALKSKHYYQTKSNDELMKLFRKQVFMHKFCSVSSRDDVEYYAVEGLLIERGFTEVELHKIYLEVIAEGEKWRKERRKMTEDKPEPEKFKKGS